MAELGITCPPQATSSGITLEEHETIDSLVHNLSEDSHTDIVRSDGKVSQVSTLTAPAGTEVRETLVSRDPSGTVTGTVDIQYNTAGVEIQRLITTINRNSQGTVISVETEELP